LSILIYYEKHFESTPAFIIQLTSFDYILSYRRRNLWFNLFLCDCQERRRRKLRLPEMNLLLILRVSVLKRTTYANEYRPIQLYLHCPQSCG